MKKIKKVDPRLGQSVLSFGCPCGTCSSPTSCACVYASESVRNKTDTAHEFNRRAGGSITGGGG